MKLDADLIAEILANQLVPATQAAKVGPRSDVLIERFCGGAVEQMQLIRRIDRNTLSRDELTDLVDLLCRIEKWLDFAKTTAGDLSKSVGLQHAKLENACSRAIDAFDEDLIQERHNVWRRAIPVAQSSRYLPRK